MDAGGLGGVLDHFIPVVKQVVEKRYFTSVKTHRARGSDCVPRRAEELQYQIEKLLVRKSRCLPTRRILANVRKYLGIAHSDNRGIWGIGFECPVERFELLLLSSELCTTDWINGFTTREEDACREQTDETKIIPTRRYRDERRACIETRRLRCGLVIGVARIIGVLSHKGIITADRSNILRDSTTACP